VFIEGDRPDIAGFTHRTTSTAATATWTCMSKRRCRCCGPPQASVRSNSWRVIAIPTTSPPAAQTRTRPNCCTSRLNRGACGARTSVRFAHRASTNSTCRNCQSTFYAGGFALQIDPCEAGSPERSGPDRVEVEQLCLAQECRRTCCRLRRPSHDADGFVGGNPDLARKLQIP
jgi:hypothetical protein